MGLPGPHLIHLCICVLQLGEEMKVHTVVHGFCFKSSEISRVLKRAGYRQMSGIHYRLTTTILLHRNCLTKENWEHLPCGYSLRYCPWDLNADGNTLKINYIYCEFTELWVHSLPYIPSGTYIVSKNQKILNMRETRLQKVNQQSMADIAIRVTSELLANQEFKTFMEQSIL